MPDEKTKNQEPKVDATQPVETDAYVPTYKVKPELKQAILQAIFNFTKQLKKYYFNIFLAIVEPLL